MRPIATIVRVIPFLMTAAAPALVVVCLATGRDLLAIYWGAFAIVALRFGVGLPEPD